MTTEPATVAAPSFHDILRIAGVGAANVHRERGGIDRNARTSHYKEVTRVAVKETLASAVEYQNKDLGQLLRVLCSAPLPLLLVRTQLFSVA